LKLLQLNIWNGRLYRKVLELIEAEQPDILCLQEVFHGPTETVMLEQQFNNRRTILAASGYEHGFFSPAAGVNFGGYTVDMGNLIVSKYPLLGQQTIFTAGEYAKQTNVTKNFPNVRNLQICRVEISGKSLTVANHHGYWLTDPMGNEDTIRSFQVVAEALKSVETPLVFAGDLNVIPEAPAMRVFDGFLEDLTATYNLETTLSELGKAFNVPCDHILVSPEIKVTDYRTSDMLVSDHKAVILEFDI